LFAAEHSKTHDEASFQLLCGLHAVMDNDHETQ
jgi:hypothetical protein